MLTRKQVHPVQLAAVGLYNFVRINPFPVGNGRVGRLLMNLIFLRNNFYP